MKVGLGTGSTVAHLLPALAARGLKDLRCVATSVATEEQARELGIPVEDFDQLDRLDIAIDGADQIAPDRWLVKGGGGAHTREKIVAASAESFVVIADSSKTVDRIAAPIPLELSAFGLASTLARIAPSWARSISAPGHPAQPGRRRDRGLPRRGPRAGRARRSPLGDARASSTTGCFPRGW